VFAGLEVGSEVLLQPAKGLNVEIGLSSFGNGIVEKIGDLREPDLGKELLGASVWVLNLRVQRAVTDRGLCRGGDHWPPARSAERKRYSLKHDVEALTIFVGKGRGSAAHSRNGTLILAGSSWIG
jgi:hypothetical protein